MTGEVTGAEAKAPRVDSVRNPEVEFVDGVVAVDVITLRLAAEKMNEKFGTELKIPEEAKNARGSFFESLAQVDVEGLRVTTTIDTGKMKWENPERVGKSTMRAYNGEIRQTAKFKDGGKVVQAEGVAISRQKMVTPEGEEVYAWFAELPEETSDKFKRYGLVSAVQNLMEAYEIGLNKNHAEQFDYITVPATQTDYRTTLHEILEANPELEDANQIIKLGLDYTGARALASTTLLLRGAGPIEEYFEFGFHGPVAFWFTGIEDPTPFAINVTKPEAWLTPEQDADFNF